MAVELKPGSYHLMFIGLKAPFTKDARVPVTLVLELSHEAAAPTLAKGARVDLVIARGATRISASGVALDDAELGEVKSFRVSSTGKVLRARLDSPTLAVVVTP